LLKIGDFSRIAHVSIKTLRHYAHEGLLEPFWIDRFSGYRYYALEQLLCLNQNSSSMNFWGGPKRGCPFLAEAASLVIDRNFYWPGKITETGMLLSAMELFPNCP
jgi:hypothetical protein